MTLKWVGPWTPLRVDQSSRTSRTRRGQDQFILHEADRERLTVMTVDFNKP